MGIFILNEEGVVGGLGNMFLGLWGLGKLAMRIIIIVGVVNSLWPSL